MKIKCKTCGIDLTGNLVIQLGPGQAYKNCYLNNIYSEGYVPEDTHFIRSININNLLKS